MYETSTYVLLVFFSKISNNMITELPLGSFTSANSALRELDLSYNKIKVLLEDLFSDLSSLQEL